MGRVDRNFEVSFPEAFISVNSVFEAGVRWYTDTTVVHGVVGVSHFFYSLHLDYGNGKEKFTATHIKEALVSI